MDFEIRKLLIALQRTIGQTPSGGRCRQQPAQDLVSSSPLTFILNLPEKARLFCKQKCV